MNLRALDQGMLFLSLANYLDDGIVWRIFERDPITINGKKLLAEYFSPHPEYSALYRKRDSEGLPENNHASTQKKLSERITLDPEAPENGILTIDYDLSRKAQCSISRALSSRNMSAYNAVSFRIKGDKDARFTHSYRIELESMNSGAAYKFKGVTDEWREVSIPLREFGGKHTGWTGANSFWGGFITDRGNMTKINFVFDLADSSEEKGRVLLSDLCFESIDPKDIPASVSSLNDFPDSPVWSKGILDDFGTIAGWTTNEARGASIKIRPADGS